MNLKRLIEMLNALRAEWMGKRGDPFFEGKGDWLNGVIKGIDLSIWTLATYARRMGQ